MEPVIEFTSNQEDVAPMYACGNCKMLAAVTGQNTHERAAKCCLCEDCGAVEKPNFRTVCEPCEKSRSGDRKAKRLVELEALPEVEYNGGPVYGEAGDKWYDELVYFLDDVSDGEMDPHAVVHPGIVSKAPLPDVISYIEESISENFDEDYGPYLTKEDEERIALALDQIKLPDVWNANTKVRLRRSWLEANDG